MKKIMIADDNKDFNSLMRTLNFNLYTKGTKYLIEFMNSQKNK